MMIHAEQLRLLRLLRAGGAAAAPAAERAPRLRPPRTPEARYSDRCTSPAARSGRVSGVCVAAPREPQVFLGEHGQHRNRRTSGRRPAVLPKSAPCASVPVSTHRGRRNPSYPPDKDVIVKLLNEALATEIVCVLRYKRHYFATRGLSAQIAAQEFLEHANQEQVHADEIAERIVQLRKSRPEPDHPDGSQPRGVSRGTGLRRCWKRISSPSGWPSKAIAK